MKLHIKKELVLFSLGFLLFFSSCENFFEGSSLKNQLDEKIDFTDNKNPLTITQASPVFQQGGVPQNSPIKIVFNHAVNSDTFNYSIEDNNGNNLNSRYKNPVFNEDKTIVYIYFNENAALPDTSGTKTITVTIDKNLKDVFNRKFSYEDFSWNFSVNKTIDQTAPVIDFCNFTDLKKASEDAFKTSSFENYDLLKNNNEENLNTNNILRFSYANELMLYVEGYSDVTSIENIVIRETLVNYDDGTEVKNPRTVEKTFTPNETNCIYSRSQKSKDSFIIKYNLSSVMDGAVKFEVLFTGSNGVLSNSKSFKIIKFSTINLSDIKVTNAPGLTYNTWDFDYNDDDEAKPNASFENLANDLRNLRWWISSTSIYKNISPSVKEFNSTLRYGEDLDSLQIVDNISLYEETETGGIMHAILPEGNDYFFEEKDGNSIQNLGLPAKGAVAELTVSLESINLTTKKIIYFPAMPVKLHAFQEITEIRPNVYRLDHYVYFENYKTPNNKNLKLIYYTRKHNYSGFDKLHITGETGTGVLFSNENTWNNFQDQGLIDTDNDGLLDNYDSDHCIYAGWDSRQCASYKTEDEIYGAICPMFEVEPYWNDVSSFPSFNVDGLTYSPSKKSTRDSNLIDVNIKVTKSIKEIAQTRRAFGIGDGYKYYQYSILKVYLTPDKDNFDNSNLAACTIIGNTDIAEGEKNYDMKEAVVTVDFTQWWNQYMIVETVIAGHFTPFASCNIHKFEPLSIGGKEIINGLPQEAFPEGSICTLNKATIKRNVNTGKIEINSQIMVKETDLQELQQMFTTQKNITVTETNFDLLGKTNSTLQSALFSEFTQKYNYGINQYLYNYLAEYDELESDDYTLSGKFVDKNSENIGYYSLKDIITTKNYSVDLDSKKVKLSNDFTDKKNISVIIHNFENDSWDNENVLEFKDSALPLPPESFISVQLSIQQEKYNQLAPRKIFYNGTKCNRAEFYKFFEEGTKKSYWIVSDKPALIRILQSDFDRGNTIEDWEADPSIVKESLTNNDETFTNDAFIFDSSMISHGKYFTVIAYFADNSKKIIEQGFRK